MLESAIQKKILDHLAGLPHTWAVKVMVANRNGTPDILAVVNGVFVAIEVKTPTGRLEPIQKAQLERIAAAGGLTLVARSVEDVETAMLKLTNY